MLAFWTSHSKYAQFSRFVFAISSLLRNVYCFVKKRVRLPYQKDSRFCIDCGNPLAIVEPIDDGIRRSYSANSRSPLANKKYAQGKDPNLAVILSVFIPGLGQFYNGDILKGVVMLVGSIIFTFFPPIGIVAFRVWSSVDGYQVAKGNQSLWK